MKRTSFALALLGALCLAPLAAQDVQVELQRAIQKEVATGDLKAAIAEYQAVVRRAGANKAVAAQALIRMADAHRKLGDAEAGRLYERVLREYPDQKDAVEHARAALAASNARASAVRGPSLRLISAGDIDGMGTVSTDGRYLSFTDWTTGDLAIRDLDTNTTRRLTNTGGWTASGDFAEYSALSADGSQIAYAWYIERGPRKDLYELRLLSTSGNGRPRILHAVDGLLWIRPVQFTADGRSIIAIRELKGDRHEIVRIPLADGDVRVLKAFGATGVNHAALSPDERYLAYAAASDDRNGRDIHLIDLQKGTEAPVSIGRSDDRDVFWSPDGSSLVFVSDRTGTPSLWRWSIGTGKASGAPERLSTEVTPHLMGVSATGSLFVRKAVDPRNVYVADLDAAGNVVRQPALLSERFLDFNRGAEWSHDGRYVAFYSSRGLSARGPGSSLVVFKDLQSGEHREIALPFEVPSGPATAIRWFPDGASVLVVAREPIEGVRRQNLAYFRLSVRDGSVALIYRPSADKGVTNRPDLSPDGGNLYFAEGEWSEQQQTTLDRLIRLDIPTGRKTELKTGWIGSLAVSPDGSRVAFLGAPDHRVRNNHVGVISATGGQPQVLFESDWFPPARLGSLGWSRDGRHLVFANREKEGGPQEFWRLPVAGGHPQKLGVMVNGHLKAPAASPDGRRLAYTAVEDNPSELWALDNLLPTKKTRGRQ